MFRLTLFQCITNEHSTTITEIRPTPQQWCLPHRPHRHTENEERTQWKTKGTQNELQERRILKSSRQQRPRNTDKVCNLAATRRAHLALSQCLLAWLSAKKRAGWSGENNQKAWLFKRLCWRQATPNSKSPSGHTSHEWISEFQDGLT